MTNEVLAKEFKALDHAGKTFYSNLLGHWVAPFQGEYLYYAGRGLFKTAQFA